MKRFVAKAEEKHVLTKPVTSQTSPNKKKDVIGNINVIAPGMYKLKIDNNQEMHAQANKSVSTSSTLRDVISVRRPSRRRTSWKNSVLSQTKILPENVEVHCLAKYKLSVNSKVRRALFTTPKAAKSKFLDPTLVVVKTSFVEKFMGKVRFGNDHFAAITRDGDYVHGNVTICHVYYVGGLGHHIFSVGQIYDSDLEVAFRSKMCYVRNLKGEDLLSDLDDLFGPLYDEYYEKRQPKVSTNSAAPITLNNEDIPSLSTIIVDDNDAPQIVSTSEEPTSSISNDRADESVQEDNADLDRNNFINQICSHVAEENELSMHEFYQLHRSTD
ncbi:hypothetical protein Tco_0356079 [Tanacetum coccineum]